MSKDEFSKNTKNPKPSEEIKTLEVRLKETGSKEGYISGKNLATMHVLTYAKEKISPYLAIDAIEDEHVDQIADIVYNALSAGLKIELGLSENAFEKVDKDHLVHFTYGVSRDSFKSKMKHHNKSGSKSIEQVLNIMDSYFEAHKEKLTFNAISPGLMDVTKIDMYKSRLKQVIEEDSKLQDLNIDVDNIYSVKELQRAYVQVMSGKSLSESKIKLQSKLQRDDLPPPEKQVAYAPPTKVA